MFRFEHPEYFWCMAGIPLLILLYLLSRWLLRRQGRKFATDRALARLLRFRSDRKQVWKTVLVFFSLTLLCVALANPQWGLRRETVEAKSADIFIALDISTSMYAQDIAPSRMERAKKFAADLVNALRGERIGIILFAGNAYLQMPLTSDYAAAELFIRSAHPGLASTQGTALGEAIDLALRAYVDEAGHQKALIVLTDGENHEEGAIEAMDRGSEAGLVPFLIAVGTAEGALIPVQIQGRADYKRDETGNPVRSAVNEEFLREVAEAGDGYVYQIGDGDFVIRDIREKIDDLEKREMEQRAFKDFESYYQHFLFGGFVLLLIVSMTGDQRRKSGTQEDPRL